MIHEYIIQVDDTDRSLDFAFVGQIRRTCKQLVRCKDCKHYGVDMNRMNCNVFCCSVPENGFCSMGERKE